MSFDEVTSYKIDQALTARLENERVEELTLVIQNILKAGGFEVKQKKNVNVNLKKDGDIPTVSEVLSSLMGQGVVME